MDPRRAPCSHPIRRRRYGAGTTTPAASASLPPCPAPERLRPDNVTPPSRTPWGGRVIATHLKDHVALPDGPIGEAWEVSCEPSFPSRLERTGERLPDAIARDPVAWLGAAVAERYGGQSPLLVKLLDAGESLSVQVHPAVDDPSLGPDESGKPEAWVILRAAPGAGIYLGFRDGVTRAAVGGAIASGATLAPLLNFVPVAPGDVFVVAAGTVHAIGAGVTLVEPQLVTPGKRGVTYRLWDWDRRYDTAGRRDPSGSPRALHVERALEVVDWGAAQGADAVERCRARPKMLDPGSPQPGGNAPGHPSRTRLASTPWFEVERWRGAGTLEIPVSTLVALTCVGGRARVAAPGGAVDLRRGESAVVPAEAGYVMLTGWADGPGGDADVVAVWAVG